MHLYGNVLRVDLINGGINIMAIDPKAMIHIKRVLLQFGNKYFAVDGSLKRANVIDDLDNYDKELISAILQDDFLRRNYTTQISGINFFEVDKLSDMLHYREYWEDSFTKYNNGIGLAVGDRYIKDSSDVVLNFPYKDCVLKAGMTKDDVESKEDANEPFLNEVLAHSELDELKEPKIFTNITLFNKEGKHKVSSFDNDNLFIKGNNLISLYSIQSKYSNKIKFIYLDPPYNTDNERLPYNDRFNHATWLTFMKNRLEIAKELLTDDGYIAIQTDDGEQAYLKVLMDSIFGRKNYINTVSVLLKNIAGASGGGEDKRLKKNIEFITIYAKNYQTAAKFHSVYSYVEIGELLRRMRKNGISWKYTSVLINPGEAKLIGSTTDAAGDKIELYKRENYRIESISKLMKKEKLNESEAYAKYADRIFQTAMPQSSIRPAVIKKYREITKDPNELLSIKYVPRSGKNKGKLYEQFYKGDNFRLFAWLKDVSIKKDGKLYKTEKQGTFWDLVGSTKNVNKEGSVTLSNGKKPEELIARLIKMCTNEGEYVLDFFAGSGTTAATAMKMNRRFISCEQMNYQVELAKTRLNNVIHGDKTGVSDKENWNGGSSFIYTELLKKNDKYLQEIRKSENMDDLMKVYENMKGNSDIDFRVNLSQLDADLKAGKFPTLNERKQELIHILDKNQLYYSKNDLNDINIKNKLSKEDYQLNQDFYKGSEF